MRKVIAALAFMVSAAIGVSSIEVSDAHHFPRGGSMAGIVAKANLLLCSNAFRTWGFENGATFDGTTLSLSTATTSDMAYDAHTILSPSTTYTLSGLFATASGNFTLGWFDGTTRHNSTALSASASRQSFSFTTGASIDPATTIFVSNDQLSNAVTVIPQDIKLEQSASATSYISDTVCRQTYTASGAFTYTAPATGTIRIKAWGGGGSGSDDSHTGNTPRGGGAGAFSQKSLYAITANHSLTGTVGAGGVPTYPQDTAPSGGDTSVLDGATTIVLAKGGIGGSSIVSGNTGGQASAGIGDILFSGGNGAGWNGVVGTLNVGGGGGAAGPDGNGTIGTLGATSGSQAGGGGQADDATGPAGGSGGTSGTNSPGQAGTTDKLLGGSGGGGGYWQSATGSPVQSGGNGGAPGGGGGAGFGNQGVAQAFGGSGAIGEVDIQYVVAPPPPGLPSGFFVAIAGNGGSDSNPGTLASPFLTLGKCQTAMRGSANKFCFIRAGTYNQSSPIALTSSDNGETWQYYPPDGVNTAVLDGANTLTGGFFNGSVSNITINGIKMQNFNDYGVNFQSNSSTTMSNILIENCDIGPNTNSTFQSAGINLLGNIPNARIIHNYVHDTGSQGIAMFDGYTFAGNTTGATMDSNVVLRAVQRKSDGAPLYTSGHGGSVTGYTITNNFVRDQGASGIDSIGGVYLDDFASGVTVSGNIIGPPNPAANGSHGTLGVTVHNGHNNSITNNIIDLGTTAKEYTVLYFWDGGAVFPNPPTGLSAESFTNNIVVSNFAGNQLTSFAGVNNGFSFYQNNGTAGTYTISNNAYHNYGGGQERTDGPTASDSNPQHITAANLKCTTYLYALDPTSVAFNAPVNFPLITGGWGPPGFTVPSSTNHSCT